MTTGDVIDIHKKLYNLPELEYEEQVPDGLLRLYQKKHYFVVISIYNLKHQHLLIRDFNKGIGWELPGGNIHKEESIETAVNRILLDETGFEIDELTPIAVVKNIFKYEDRQVIHRGIAFIALSRGKIKTYSKNIQTCFTTQIPEKIAYQNDVILKLAKKYVETIKYIPPIKEIESIKNKSFSFLYILHKYFIKHIGNFSSKKIRNKIFDLIDGKPKTILDASCVDCSLINELYNKYKPEICIGNDISWKTITLIKNNPAKIIFTNHNVLDMPYQIKFDLIIFKNTLHHIEKKHQKDVLDNLKKLTKQLIVVDIDDPQNSSLLSKMWNNYYVYLLDDQGENFLKLAEFKRLLKSINENRKITTGGINTIKGNYFYADIKD